MKTAKKQFLASVVSLLLCVSMLVGTTFAWFTDSVASNDNFIKSGNLDVTLEYYDGDGNQWKSVEETPSLIDNNAEWEPGFAQVVYLRIANAGSLALKYQLSANILSDEPGTNVEGNEFYLSDYIKFGVKESATAEFYSEDKAGRDAAVADVDANAKLISSADKAEGELLSGEETFVTYVVYMPASVGNAANHNGSDIPEINLGVNLFATQLDYEGDDFGTDYDEDAPIVSAPVARPSTGNVSIKGGSSDNEVVVKVDSSVIEALPSDVTEIGIAMSEPVYDTVANTISYANVDLVDQNGEVIDLAAISTGTANPVTVTLAPQSVFAPGTEVAIYHDGVVIAMATVAEDTTITYVAEHFCEVVVESKETAIENGALGDWYVESVDELINAVNNAEAGDKIVVASGNYTLNAQVNVYKALTIEGFGTVNFDRVNYGGHMFLVSNYDGTVDSGFEVNIKNINLDGCSNGEKLGKAGIYVRENVVLNIENCTVKNCYWGALQIDNTKWNETAGVINAKNVVTDKVSMISLDGNKACFNFDDACDITTIEVQGGNCFVNDSAVANNTVMTKDADKFVEALETKKNVSLLGDIKIDPAKMSNAYGKTGINVKYGQTVDGRGYTINVKGAGGTWDSGINTTGGVIKNLTVTGSFRGIFVNHNSTHSETVVLENVTTTGTVYTVSCDQGKNQNLVATDCTFLGWTSYATTLGTAEFNGCYFGEGSGYAFMRPYAPTTYVGCTFEEGFKIDPKAVITLEGCYYGETLVTADNIVSVGLVSESSMSKVTVK